MTKAMFAFSADPIHRGHIDIIERASKLFDSFFVGIGVNDKKKDRYLFSLEERTEMAKQSLSHLPNVEVIHYDSMTVDYAYNNNIPVIVKAVRNAADVEYEKTMDENNKSQKLGIETITLFGDPNLSHISSTAAKEIQSYHGNVHEHVTFNVKQALEKKMFGQYMVGVTGESGCGKSYLCDKLVEIGKRKNIPIHHIEFDHIGHQILGTRKKPVYESIQQKVVDTFGEQVRLPDRTINRSPLGEIVFNDYKKLQDLNKIMETPMLVDLREALNDHEGIVLINGALIAESNLGYLCNNNVVLIDVDKASQERRLKERKIEGKPLTAEQIARRLGSQYNFAKKREELEKAINKEKYGKLWIINNSDNSDPAEIEKTFDNLVEYFKIK